ncbi:peroxidase-related enzyme [Acuticoccus sp.]|uniref:peroxidase-related enzyme n=1 Tax=Acuticoccus sp. TaxID=1904378 RepID=UPI003B525AD5
MAGDELVTSLDLPRAELSAETEAYFEKCREKLGLVPNVLIAYAFDEAKLRAFTEMYNELMLGPSGLSKLERELIAVVVSAANRCHYCIVAHGAALRQLSGDPILVDTIVANWHAAELSDRHAAICAYASAVTLTPHLVGPDETRALHDAGFTDRDVWDITAVAAFFNMTNRVATATKMRPNTEYYSAARG